MVHFVDCKEVPEWNGTGRASAVYLVSAQENAPSRCMRADGGWQNDPRKVVVAEADLSPLMNRFNEV